MKNAVRTVLAGAILPIALSLSSRPSQTRPILKNIAMRLFSSLTGYGPALSIRPTHPLF